MLCTLSCASCPLPHYPLPYGFNLNFTKLYTLKKALFQTQSWFPTCKHQTMNVKGKSPPRGNLYKPRGENVPRNRDTVCFSDLTGLRAPCFKARHESVKRFPWVTILFGSSYHEDNICGETEPKKHPLGCSAALGTFITHFQEAGMVSHGCGESPPLCRLSHRP